MPQGWPGVNARGHTILTIGHSDHSLDAFAGLLRAHDVGAVADVRSAPYSRHNPQFGREALECGLKSRGIGYLFLGRELGGRSRDRSCYEKGRIQYARLARTGRFRDGVERVTRTARERCLALMCAEREPLLCHRAILVARALAEAGLDVAHILADGGLEPHADAIDRLRERLGLAQRDLFDTDAELVGKAYATQGARIAHATDQGTDGEPAGRP